MEGQTLLIAATATAWCRRFCRFHWYSLHSILQPSLLLPQLQLPQRALCRADANARYLHSCCYCYWPCCFPFVFPLYLSLALTTLAPNAYVPVPTPTAAALAAPAPAAPVRNLAPVETIEDVFYLLEVVVVALVFWR